MARLFITQVLLIASTAIIILVANSRAAGVEDVIPKDQKPISKVFPPPVAQQSEGGTGKFVIFTREQLSKEGDYVAGAWECIPSHPEIPITKRAEFCHSSWEADQLLDSLVRDDSEGKHPRFVRLQFGSSQGNYGVNLYDINYRTWEVRCLWQGERLKAFGLLGDAIYCNSSEGWLLLETASGTLSRSAPFIPIGTDGNYWLVRKPGEREGCWSYHRLKRQFIAPFGPVDRLGVGFSQSLLSADGKSRLWVLAPMPEDWRGGTIKGTLIVQGLKEKTEVSVPIEMQAGRGSGRPVLPLGIELKFSPHGEAEFRASKGKNSTEDQVWTINLASGKVSSRVENSPAVADRELAVLGKVPVPDYLRKYAAQFSHFGRGGLAPAFLMHLGILKEEPEYPDCTVGVSPDGRYVLYAAKKGPLSGYYIYGDLLTKETVRWPSPDGLDGREFQQFVWVETPY